MAIRIVSQSKLLCDFVAGACAARGLMVSETLESFDGITHLDADDILLVHVVGTETGLQSRLSSIATRFPLARIIILALNEIPREMALAFEAMAAAVIPKTASTEAMLSILILAQQGYHVSSTGTAAKSTQDFFDLNHHLSAFSSAKTSEQVDTLPQDPGMAQAAAAASQLSKREVAILAQLSSGRSNKEIARSLGICDATVKVHLRTSFRKIGVSNRTQAAMWTAKHF